MREVTMKAAHVPQLRIEYVATSDLVPYAGNAKEHGDDDVAAIAESINELMFDDPVGVWTNDAGMLEIVEGHGRVLAAKELGIETLPVIKLDHLTDDQRRAYTHIHNQTTLNTGFDMSALMADLATIPDFDWRDFGFEMADGSEVEELDLESIIEDASGMADEVETLVQPGQVWQLGDHVLMCGDATNPEDMAALMAGDRPVMVFTDPPYGVSIGGKNRYLSDGDKFNRSPEDITNDDMTADELYDFVVCAMSVLKNACDEACSYYVTSPQGGELCGVMLNAMRDAGLPVRHMLIWAKEQATFSMGRLDYDYSHEPIFYTWGARHEFFGGYGRTVIEDAKPLEKMSKAELKDLVRELRGTEDTSVIHVDKPLKSAEHPTMKPVKLVARFVYNSSRPGDIVADVFGGSGTTLMACEQLGRKCRMMEIDPQYCDVIIDRWESYTGRMAEQVR